MECYEVISSFLYWLYFRLPFMYSQMQNSNQFRTMYHLITKRQLKYKWRAQLNLQNENNQNQYLIDGQTLINL